MIKANELRIGNWVHDTVTQQPHEIEGWDIFETSAFVGISLTPEILEKCGLTHVSVDDYYLANGLMLHKTGYVFYSYWEHSDGDGGGTTEDEVTNIKYVHQLQNLYFALTGEELKIEL
jgi:hypothetical protein